MAKVQKKGVREAERDAELRTFVADHPDGWNHHAWLGLLDRLRERGHDANDTDAVGVELERHRIRGALSGVDGVGPRRIDALAERFGSLWALRHADADEIAAVPGVPRAIAERIRNSLR